MLEINTQIILAFIWVCVMLIYLLGDVLRIFSGDAEKGKMLLEMRKMGQGVWVGIAMLMLTPIIMIFLTLVLPYEVNRWANLIMSGFWLLFNLLGLPSYPSMYDRFLLLISMIFNVLAIYYAWNWVI